MSDTHSAEVLLLTCMDYRMTGHVASYLDSRGLAGRYDIVALAGAAIGVMSPDTENWGAMFWDQLDLAVRLHGINRVIVVDHRDCGACKVLVHPDCGTDKAEETRIHTGWMSRLSAAIHEKAPDLTVETILMDLDGQAEVM